MFLRLSHGFPMVFPWFFMTCSAPAGQQVASPSRCNLVQAVAVEEVAIDVQVALLLGDGDFTNSGAVKLAEMCTYVYIYIYMCMVCIWYVHIAYIYIYIHICIHLEYYNAIELPWFKGCRRYFQANALSL